MQEMSKPEAFIYNNYFYLHMFNSKTAQAAAGAAVFVAIVAGLIIMFIIMVNPQERAALLGDDDSTVSTTTTSGNYLLKVNPGRIDYLAQNRVEHPLPVVTIHTKTEGKILAEKSLAKVKKGVFSEETSKLLFTIPDLANTKDLLLTFRPEETVGKVKVSLNGELIFEDEPIEGNLKPIKLPSNLLTEDNEILFESTSPGAAFWHTNSARLNNVKVVADVTSVEFQSSESVFLVSDTEKKNLEKIDLEFLPECEFSKGKLTIKVNGNQVFKGVPDCGVPMAPIPLLSDMIVQGQNRISFSIDQGSYILSHVNLDFELSEVDFPVYYFDVSSEHFVDVTQNDHNVKLKVDFVDVVAEKRLDLTINGILKTFETKDLSYTIDISDEIVQGTNAIKVKPKKTVDIREMSVKLQ